MRLLVQWLPLHGLAHSAQGRTHEQQIGWIHLDFASSPDGECISGCQLVSDCKVVGRNLLTEDCMYASSTASIPKDLPKVIDPLTVGWEIQTAWAGRSFEPYIVAAHDKLSHRCNNPFFRGAIL